MVRGVRGIAKAATVALKASVAKTKMVAKRISKRITSETPQQSVVIPNVTKTASETPQTSVVVQVTNNWAFLTSCSPSLLEKLQTSLSFPRKVYRPPSYRGPHVPPTVVGFITKKGRFGTGLLPIVLNMLDAEKAKYTVKDQRTSIPQLFAKDPNGPSGPSGPNASPSGSKYKEVDASGTLFDDVGVTLRDYQIQAANAALQHHRGIIKCATGGGKTWILAAILKVLGEGVPTVIVVNQRVLAEQMYATLTKAGIKDVGMMIGGTHEAKTITICTIQTLQRSKPKPKQLANARVLMVDEVHEYATKLSRDTFNEFSQAYMRLGFSATPFKHSEHKHMLLSMFGPAIVDIAIDELVAKQVITNSVVNFHSITYPEIVTSSWQVAEEKGIIYNTYFHESVVALVNSIPDGRIMVLVQRIAHGDALHKLLPGSFWISGKDESDARAEVLEKLRSATDKKVVALVSSIGFVGVDVFVHHLINAAGGREPYLTIQKIGRGLRKASDKEILHYHDFLFSLNMNRMLCGQSLARMKTLKQNGYEVIRQPAILRRPNPYPLNVKM